MRVYAFGTCLDVAEVNKSKFTSFDVLKTGRNIAKPCDNCIQSYDALQITYMDFATGTIYGPAPPGYTIDRLWNELVSNEYMVLDHR